VGWAACICAGLQHDPVRHHHLGIQGDRQRRAAGGLTTAFLVPFLLLSPVAGVMVDRYSRKLMMMVSDLFAVLATSGVFILFLSGRLEIWHVYVSAVMIGSGNSFQWPAYSAAITTMVPKEHYSRANGMWTLIDSAPSVVSPMLAGAILPLVGLKGILIFDVTTFFLAIAALLAVHIPQPMRTEEGKAGEGNFLKEATYGFRYIFERRGLLGLLMFFMVLNFTVGMAFNVFAPMILSRTGNSSAALGAAQSAGAIGAVAGGLLVSLWGGFKAAHEEHPDREALTGFFLMMLGFGRDLPAWMIAGALVGIWFPFVNGASQAIWQVKWRRRAGQGVHFAAVDRLAARPDYTRAGWGAGGLRNRADDAPAGWPGDALHPTGGQWSRRRNSASVHRGGDSVYGDRGWDSAFHSSRARPGRPLARSRSGCSRNVSRNKHKITKCKN